MIDKDYRHHRIRDLAERILFAGISNGFLTLSQPSAAVADSFRVAETFVDYSILKHPTTDDECEDKEDDEPAASSIVGQDSL